MTEEYYNEFREELKSYLWKEKESQILQRDNHRCTQCGNQEDLGVYHTYYAFDKKPWEYSNLHLLTLCDNCARKLGKEVFITSSYRTLTPCKKCYGAGHYLYLDKRLLCLRCYGSKYEEFFPQRESHKWFEERLVELHYRTRKLSQEEISKFVGYDTKIISAIIKLHDPQKVELGLEGGEVIIADAGPDVMMQLLKEYPNIPEIAQMDVDSLYFRKFDKGLKIIIMDAKIKQES